MFFENRKEYQKGPNNIVDMWKDFNLSMTMLHIKDLPNMFLCFRECQRGG
jgi:hypothetical protein